MIDNIKEYEKLIETKKKEMQKLRATLRAVRDAVHCNQLIKPYKTFEDEETALSQYKARATAMSAEISTMKSKAQGYHKTHDSKGEAFVKAMYGVRKRELTPEQKREYDRRKKAESRARKKMAIAE